MSTNQYKNKLSIRDHQGKEHVCLLFKERHLVLTFREEGLLRQEYEFGLPFRYDELKRLIHHLIDAGYQEMKLRMTGYRHTDRGIKSLLEEVRGYLTYDETRSPGIGYLHHRLSWIPETLKLAQNASVARFHAYLDDRAIGGLRSDGGSTCSYLVPTIHENQLLGLYKDCYEENILKPGRFRHL
nr:MAG TPA: hypothetical protein [Caudoviricetes sp.]